MSKVTTRAAAEEAIQELPDVIGVSVREDIHGHPREVHILIAPGPNPRDLARTVRMLLQERLGREIDQRIISIAQLARNLEANGSRKNETRSAEPTREGTASAAPAVFSHGLGGSLDNGAGPGVAAPKQMTSGRGTDSAPTPRVIFQGVESTSRGGRIAVGITLSWRGEFFTGRGEDLVGGDGGIRAAARATLAALMLATDGRIRLDLESATRVRALGREYVVIASRASAQELGRRPMTLVGAQPIELDVETAAALATLQSLNRVLVRILE